MQTSEGAENQQIVSPEEAVELARFGFGLSSIGTSPLPSYDDQNIKVFVSEQSPIVIKVASIGSACRG